MTAWFPLTNILINIIQILAISSQLRKGVFYLVHLILSVIYTRRNSAGLGLNSLTFQDIQALGNSNKVQPWHFYSQIAFHLKIEIFSSMKIAQNSPDLIQTWINVVFPPHNGFCLRCYLQEAQSQSGQEQKWKKLDQVYCAWNESKKEKLFIMEGFQKLKWKFRMAFAIKRRHPPLPPEKFRRGGRGDHF